MKYNIKVSKLEDGSYKLKINNYSRYEVEEVEALAIKYLQTQLQQKDNTIKEVREYIKTHWAMNAQKQVYLYELEDRKELLEILKGSDSNE